MTTDNDFKCPAFSERLRAARKYRKMSQMTLSDTSFIHETTIGKYEANKVYPSIMVAEILAKALNVSPAWLCGWSDDGGIPDKEGK